MTLRACITNLGKYNEGELVGQWVDFPCGEDEFEDILTEIGIDEYHEEWFVTDYECEIGEVAQELGEYVSLDELNRVAEALEAWDDSGLTEAVVEIWGVDTLLNSTPDDYHFFEADSDEDIGYYYAEEFGLFSGNNNDVLERYFDYEAYGRDIRFETDGGLSSNGYFIERIN